MTKQRRFCLGWLMLVGMLAAAHVVGAASIDIPFYSTRISITYNTAVLLPELVRLDEASFGRAYRQLSSGGASQLVTKLRNERSRLQLNDYLYYRLVRQSVDRLYAGGSPHAQELTLFYLLAESGYDVRLTYRADRLYVNVYTEDDVFEVPIIQDAGRSYANISCEGRNCRSKQSLYLSDLRPSAGGRAFGFRLQQWPLLPSQPRTRTISFRVGGTSLQLPVTYDATVVEIMRDYPLIAEFAYVQAPLSSTLRASLLPALRKLLQATTQQQSLELLVSLTRSGFAYQNDNTFFGRSKPMVAEEVFAYEYSDCEDRSALFFALTRELLGLPLAVIAYEDHLSIGVAAAVRGSGFSYGGRRYVYCDPTGPANSSAIGQPPAGYEQQSFQVIGVAD